MLKREGNHFHVYKNPDMKCAVVERAHRTLRNKLYRYFTYKNTYRFVNVLQQFVKAYNNTVHTALGMAPAAVTDKHVLEICTRMNGRWSRCLWENINSMCDSMLESVKKKVKFAKGLKQNYTVETFRIVKDIRRNRPVYELDDLNGKSIEGQFFGEELSSVRVTKRSI